MHQVLDTLYEEEKTFATLLQVMHWRNCGIRLETQPPSITHFGGKMLLFNSHQIYIYFIN